MKKTIVIFAAAILCILVAASGVAAASDIDNQKYIPKVITTDDGHKSIFDAELARIARRMSSDAYDVTENSDAANDETLAMVIYQNEKTDLIKKNGIFVDFKRVK